jgi:hypothetical protein
VGEVLWTEGEWRNNHADAEGVIVDKETNEKAVRKELVVGFRTLVARLGRAHKDVRPKNEREAYAMALLAVGDFLIANGANGVISFWLAELGSVLTDLNDEIVGPLLQAQKQKSFPSNTWRRFAMVALGMTALTMAGVKREEAAACALRTVKMIRGTSAKTILSRYDDFHGGRVNNREGKRVFKLGHQRLIEERRTATRAKFEKAANSCFGLADL